ncbi:MAG: molybdenum cofactor biosynthesis protein B [Elainellaceae cyanobacterium]
MADAHGDSAGEFKPLDIAVLTISDSRTEETDRSGAYLVAQLKEAGHHSVDKQIVPDDIYQIRAIASRWIADEAVQVILTTGGTGLTGRDGTPEAIAPLLDKEIAGFGELFRYLSYQEIATSTIQSRAIAGVANSTYVFCLPGSSGACRTGWEKILRPQLDARHRPCNFADLLVRLRE